MIIRDRSYEIRYSGGRLADVYFGGEPIECVQVREYDFATGEFGPVPTRTQIKREVREFIDEAGGEALYWENR
jgi:hypothetical protein